MTDTIPDILRQQFPTALEQVEEFRGDLTITVRTDELAAVAGFVRTSLGFDMLIDICGVDMYRARDRFEVLYLLWSLERKRYLRLRVRVGEEHPAVPSLTSVWKGAEWHEREAYDMFGITFTGHPDMRRLYMPEEFEYHPLRKDFPLMGIPDSLPLPRR